MDSRQQKILEAIIDAFVSTANPVGSKMISDVYSFKVSSATIRNEMATLEREGYITQPHTSAGRIPTSRAYRMLVDQMRPNSKLMNRVRRDINKARRQHFLEEAKQKLYEAVSVLSRVSKNVSFATLPEMNRVFYLGVSNMLKQPEFCTNPAKATEVFEKLEGELYELLSALDIHSEGAIYIGEENILPEFQSCSLLAIPYFYKGFNGVMGILGSMRMDYAYNMAALRAGLEFLNS
jgi:transcriptional regulator of heat shock response